MDSGNLVIVNPSSVGTFTMMTASLLVLGSVHEVSIKPLRKKIRLS